MPASGDLLLSEISDEEGESTKSTSEDDSSNEDDKGEAKDKVEEIDEFTKRKLEIQTLLNKDNDEIELPYGHSLLFNLCFD